MPLVQVRFLLLPLLLVIQSATVEPATVTIIPSAKVYSPSGTGHFAICCHTH
jgi:hypothetical protein